jgi:hypothetical protein
MGVERKQVTLEKPSVVCGVHAEPFRYEWPKGYPTFAIRAFQIVADSGAFVNLSEFKIARITKTTPLCCRIKAMDLTKLVELYEECLPGKTAMCSRCAQVKLGAPFKYNDPRTGYGELTLTHLCFECVAHRMIAAPGRSN